MATGIARANTICKTCGKKIIKNVHTIQWVPGDRGSSRHSECFGQPDRFDASGTPLDGTGLDDVIKAIGDLGGPEIPVEQTDAPQRPVTPARAIPVDTQPASVQDPLAQMIAKVLLPILEGKLTAFVDENKVKMIVKQVLTAKSEEEIRKTQAEIAEQVKLAIEQRGMVTIAVRQPSGEVTKLEGLQHKQTPRLLRYMLRRKNVYLYGPTGSGKSTAARLASTAIRTKDHPNGLPFYYISLNPQSSATRIEGYMTPGGEYIRVLFEKAYTEGGTFCADEIDNTGGNFWTSTNNCIDSMLGSFPYGMAKRHPDFIFVGTGNTNLRGDAVYRDRKALDPATISRFTFIHWDYDLGMERAITIGKNEKALPWLQWVHKLRAWTKVNNPAMYAYTHPRACYDGADLLADGEGIADCADSCLFKGAFDATAKAAALQACPLPTEDMSVEEGVAA